MGAGDTGRGLWERGRCLQRTSVVKGTGVVACCKKQIKIQNWHHDVFCSVLAQPVYRLESCSLLLPAHSSLQVLHMQAWLRMPVRLLHTRDCAEEASAHCSSLKQVMHSTVGGKVFSASLRWTMHMGTRQWETLCLTQMKAVVLRWDALLACWRCRQFTFGPHLCKVDSGNLLKVDRGNALLRRKHLFIMSGGTKQTEEAKVGEGNSTDRDVPNAVCNGTNSKRSAGTHIPTKQT